MVRLDVAIAKRVAQAAIAYSKTRSFASAYKALRTRGAFEGADKGRRSEGWRPSKAGANAALAGSRSELAARSHDLVRNNVYAKRAKTIFESAVVGSGHTLRVESGDIALNNAVEAAWKQWIFEADTSANTTLHGLARISAGAWFESGETLIKRCVRKANDGLTVPLQIQILEADYLDSDKTQSLATGAIKQGVELDSQGRPRAYWLFDKHPQDTGAEFASSLQSKAIPRSELSHLYMVDRPGQLRGVPWLACAMMDLKNFDDYRDAERYRKTIEASVTAFVESAMSETDATPEGLGAQVTDSDGNVVEYFEPGLIAYLNGGKSVTFNKPATVGFGYMEFVRSELLGISAGLGIPYELLTGDLSQVNFSSIKVGLLEFRRMARMWQGQVFQHNFYRPVFRWWLDLAIAGGLFPERVYAFAFDAPRFEVVDRLDEAKADIAEQRGGTATMADCLAQRGSSLDEYIAARSQELARLDAAGIVLDADPRKTTAQGQAQQKTGQTGSGG